MAADTRGPPETVRSIHNNAPTSAASRLHGLGAARIGLLDWEDADHLADPLGAPLQEQQPAVERQALGKRSAVHGGVHTFGRTRIGRAQLHGDSAHSGPHRHRDFTIPRPHLHRDWAHPCPHLHRDLRHICAGSCHICAGISPRFRSRCMNSKTTRALSPVRSTAPSCTRAVSDRQASACADGVRRRSRRTGKVPTARRRRGVRGYLGRLGHVLAQLRLADGGDLHRIGCWRGTGRTWRTWRTCAHGTRTRMHTLAIRRADALSQPH